jgi:WD40 repeat protein
MRRSTLAPLSALAFVLALSSPAFAEKILTITSEPAGAVVEINGQRAGVTPVQEKMKEFWFNGPKYLWSEFLGQPMQMTVSKEGYVPQTINITAGPFRWVNGNFTVEKIYYVIKQTSFHVTLQKIEAAGASPYSNGRTPITVSSEPSGAEIHVDGRFDSSTPSKLLLTPGPHSITVLRPGFKPWQRLVNVEPGAEKNLNAVLEGEGAGVKSAAAQSPPQTASGQKPELVVGSGHTASVTAMAFSPDGKMLASGDGSGAVKLWDVNSGSGLRTLSGEVMEAVSKGDGVSALAFSADGKTLAGARVAMGEAVAGKSSWMTEITLWDVQSGRVLSSISGHGGKIQSLAFNPMRRWLAGGGMDKTVTLWDLDTGQQFKTFTGSAEMVSVVMFSPDGAAVLSGGWDTVIELWDVASGTIMRQTKGNPAFSMARTWANMPGGMSVAAFMGIVSPSFSQAANRLAGVGDLNVVSVWDLAANVKLREFKAVEEGVSSVVLSPAGKTLARGDGVGNISLWDVDAGTELATIKRGPSSDVIALSPDSSIVAQVEEEGHVIKLWDTNDETALRKLSGHTDTINTLVFSLDSKTLVSSSDDETIKLWDVNSGRMKVSVKGHPGGVGMVLFHPQGKMLASIATDVNTGDEEGGDREDRTVRFWDAESGKELAKVTAADSDPVSIAFSVDGTLLAVGNKNRTISLLDVASGHVLRTLPASPGEIASVLFINELMLQSFSINEEETAAEIRVWEVSSGKLLKTTTFDKSSTDSKETLMLGAMPFLGISAKYFAMSLQGSSITFFEKTPGQFNPLTQTVLANLYLFGGDDWLVTTPDGYFEGSPGAWKHVRWRFNNDTSDYVAVELYFKEFYYPDLLQSVLNGKAPKPPAGRTLEETDRRQPAVSIADINGRSSGAPNAQAAGRFQTDKRMAAVTITVADNLDLPKRSDHAASSGAQDLRLFRNGSLVRVWRGDLFKLGAQDGCEQLAPEKQGEPRRVRCRAEVPVVAGANQFSAYAFNRMNVKSEDSLFSVSGAAALRRDRTLYVLAIGVGQYDNPQFNLNYPVKDAQNFGAEVRRQQELTGYYQKVEVIPLLDQGARKAFILSALKTLAEAVQPEDGVIVYFSGHGTARGDRFYLIPSDLGYKGPRRQVDAAGLETILTHSISDLELEDAFNGIDAGRLLLVIDACNSGKALQADDWRRGPMNTKGLGQLAYEKGMYVLTASQDAELAYESEALKHSYLTYALIEEGLRLKVADADADADGAVILREWFDYAKRRVPRLRQEKVELEARRQNKALEEVEVAEQGRVQRPKVFYRREPELQPFVVARPRRASAALNQ